MIALVLLYASLFGWSFLAATVLPLSSEAPLAALIRLEHRYMLPVLVATLGNYLGACTTYWLGRRTARALTARPPHAPAAEEGWAAGASLALLRRLGPPALLFSWVPVVGDVLVALAGALRLPFGAFSFWVALGKGLRYLAVAWAALSI